MASMQSLWGILKRTLFLCRRESLSRKEQS